MLANRNLQSQIARHNRRQLKRKVSETKSESNNARTTKNKTFVRSLIAALSCDEDFGRSDR